MVPSTLQPFLDNEYYYQGGFGLLEHGSQYGGDTTNHVDAIQIEVNYANRWDADNRTQFCIDFSRTIEEFVNHYYNLTKFAAVEGYNSPSTTAENATAEPDASSSTTSSKDDNGFVIKTEPNAAALLFYAIIFIIF